MKRKLSIAVLIGVALLIATAAFPPIGRQDPVPESLVIATDAPGWMRVAGTGRYLCDGTQTTGGDQVELQAAIDAMASTVGTVRVVGTLYVSKAAGTEWTLTSCAFTTATKNVNTLVFGTGTIADVAVGQIVRFWAGDDGAGAERSLEDNHEEMVCTVTTVAADNFTISTSTPIGGNYTALEARRMMPAVTLPQGVHLTGVGTMGARIKLANSQNCNILHLTATTSSVGYYVSSIRFDGNKANQNGAGTAMDRRCNGILANSYAWDVYLTNVNIESCAGDACWLDGSWGAQITGGWWEYCEGGGLYLGLVGGGQVTGTKIVANDGPAVVFRNSNTNRIIGGVYSTNGEITHADVDTYNRNEYSLKFIGNNTLANIVSAAELRGQLTNQEGAVFFHAATRNIITGCVFDCGGVSGKAPITFSSLSSLYNTITGNTFNVHSDAGIAGLDVWANNWNNVWGNSQQRWPAETQRYEWVLNNTGGIVSARTVVIRSGTGFATTTTPGLNTVLGACDGVLANVAVAEYGRVQTLGWVNYIPAGDSDGENIASGDLLCTSNIAGACREAASGNWVFAIAQSAATPGAGTTTLINAVLIPPYQLP